MKHAQKTMRCEYFHIKLIDITCFNVWMADPQEDATKAAYRTFYSDVSWSNEPRSQSGSLWALPVRSVK